MAAGRPIDNDAASVVAAADKPPEAEGASAPGNSTVATLAGLAWVASAALTGYLAFLQLEYAQSFPGSRLAAETGALAAGNGLAAAVTLFFAGRLLLGPPRRFLLTSAGWGAISVAWGAIQISQGVTADVFIGATVLAGVAGVLSFVAWQRP